jgi:hypothetical protein
MVRRATAREKRRAIDRSAQMYSAFRWRIVSPGHDELRCVLFLIMYEPSALCRLRTSGRRDAASFRSASLRAQPRAQSSGLGVVATVERASGCYFVERHVNLLCDPDPVQQNGKLPGDGHHGSSSRVASAPGTQAETPSSR